MLRQIFGWVSSQAKTPKRKPKKRVASLKVRRSDVSSNLRLGRNILRMV